MFHCTIYRLHHQLDTRTRARDGPSGTNEAAATRRMRPAAASSSGHEAAAAAPARGQKLTAATALTLRHWAVSARWLLSVFGRLVPRRSRLVPLAAK